MPSSPLGQLPLELIIKVLKKMEFREVASLRQTCLWIDNLVHLNAAHLRFPIHGVNLIYHAIQREEEVMTYETLLQLVDPKLENVMKSPCVKCSGRGIECAVFDNIIPPCFHVKEHPMEPGLIQFIQENNIQCRCLNFAFGIPSSVNIAQLYSASGAAALSLGGSSNSTNKYQFILDRIAQFAEMEFVTKWPSYYLRKKIPYDLSGLAEYIRRNQGNFGRIKEQIMQLVGNAYSYPIED